MNNRSCAYLPAGGDCQQCGCTCHISSACSHNCQTNTCMNSIKHHRNAWNIYKLKPITKIYLIQSDSIFIYISKVHLNIFSPRCSVSSTLVIHQNPELYMYIYILYILQLLRLCFYKMDKLLLLILQFHTCTEGVQTGYDCRGIKIFMTIFILLLFCKPRCTIHVHYFSRFSCIDKFCKI